MHARGIGIIALIGAALGAACGEEFKPDSGYTDPCATPMAGVMGCPAGTTGQPPGAPTVHDACRRLVRCGVLAGSYEVGTGSPGSCNPNNCSGECRPNSDGQSQCFVHRLDYAWCVDSLSIPSEYICGSSISLTPGQLANVVDCIMSTQCSALGLPFARKLSNQQNTEVDDFTCPNGSDTGTTATVCDQGLLEY